MKQAEHSKAPSSPVARATRRVALCLWAGAGGMLNAVAVPSAPVVAVQAASAADLVVLGSGFDAGLRQGMVCRVTRGATEVGEILLVDLRPTCSSALILSMAPKQSIRPGDLAAVKFSNSKLR